MEFTEKMKGHLALGETDPLAGWELGRQLAQRFMFRLTITAPDVERFVAGEDHTATAEGYVDCDLLGGTLPVQRGWANLFVAADSALTREMRYRLWFSDMSGQPLTMYGYKIVRNDRGFDMWTDTSTLYITLMRGHVLPGENGAQDAPADVVGAGILRILPLDFARQLTTFRGSGSGPLSSIARFGAFFAGSMKDVYLRPGPPPPDAVPASASSSAAPREEGS
jgi:cholesterol oxidase